MEEHICIAIDGPAGAGKSTVAKGIAKKLGIRHLDTGAMYRAMALYAMRCGADPADEAAMTALLPQADIRVTFTKEGQRVLLSGEDVTGEIRTPEISMGASLVGVHPCVRIKLSELQRQVAREYSVVMDGRDITTNVLPDTPYKFFVTASPQERARRRLHELRERGDTQTAFDTVLSDIVARDEVDSTRAFMPLTVARDAIIVDTTNMSASEATEAMFAHINRIRSE